MTMTTGGEKRERDSGLELLRIISMLLIVAHHYSVHGGYAPFTVKDLSGGVVFVQLLSMFGRTACSVFALITGFYMIEKGGRRQYRRIVSAVTEMTFYSLTITVLFGMLGLAPLSGSGVFWAALPIFGSNWYAVYYVVLLALVPFLNPMLSRLRKSEYKRLLFTVYMIWSVVPTLSGKRWSFSSLDFFLVMYMTGAYVRLHVHGRGGHRNCWNLLAMALFTALTLLSVIVFDAVGVWQQKDSIVQKANYFITAETVLSAGCAVSAFLFFSNLSFRNRAINWVAGSTFGIYLFHDNPLVRSLIWGRISPNAAHLAFPYVHALCKIPVVFLVSLAVDGLRRVTVAEPLSRWAYAGCRALGRHLPRPVQRLLREEPED